MNPAERLECHQTSVLYKFIEAGNEEEVIVKHSLALVQFLPRSLKVEINIEMLDELGDWILVCI